MNKIILSLLLSLSLQTLAETTQTVDKYTGITTTSIDLIKLNPARSISLIKMEDKSVKGLSAVIFKYYRDSANDDIRIGNHWLFIKNNNGYLMINGEPYSLGSGKHTGNTEIKGGLHLIEIVSYIIKPELLNKLSEAKTIEGKVGDSEFTLTVDQVETIKEFAINSL